MKERNALFTTTSFVLEIHGNICRLQTSACIILLYVIKICTI